ncbi:CoA transferase [Paraburkholderia sediminicola]|uniref:CoA transferase n=1 Tax=Paraburkholderia sediminicola TaxID=458836 RepID=UPI0038BBF1EE
MSAMQADAGQPVQNTQAGLLTGLKVIDFATGLAGSASALYLAEAGADVVKIERPRHESERDAALFHVLDRGKRRVTDGDLAAQRDLLDSLLPDADVLVHDLTPAEAAAWSLDDARLRQRYPALIVASVGGWPRRHALADAPVRETLVLARLGILDEQPGHRPGPVFIRMPFASWIASWLSAIGVMARLIARERDGHGGIAHTSLAQAALVPMTMHWSRAAQPTPVFAKGLDKSVPIPLHCCADGRWIHVHYSPDAAPWMAEALAAMGPDGVARANAQWPPSHVAPNFGANREIIATRNAQDWVEHFWAHDVAAQIAAPFGEIYADEQARLNGYVVGVDDPDFGSTSQPGPAYHVDPPARVRGPLQVPIAARGIGWSDTNRFSATPRADSHAASAALRPPLDGLKVLDLGAYLAGPFACMVLADLGADVIKVEPPAGDAMRRLERAFAGTQRGKRGLALKLGAEGSKPVIEALANWADIVHHNVRLPAARKLGIAPDQLRAIKPALVCAHVSSYGPQGPRADWPGFDQLMQAAVGWETESGGEGNPPSWLRFGVGDHLAALSSVFAVLLAHLARVLTGEGQVVASSLLGAMTMTASEAIVINQEHALTPMAHLDAGQHGIAPTHRLYRCKDGWIAVAALSAAESNAFTRIAGEKPEATFAALDVAAALAGLHAAGVPAEPALEAQCDAFLDSTEHAAAGLHATYGHAVYGSLQQIGALWDFDDLPLVIERAPPALGEHSRELLEMLGFDAQHIDELANQGVTRI